MQRKWLRIPIGIVIVLAVAIILLLVTARPAPQAEFYTLAGEPPLVIAHQGGDGLRPGDTLASFQNAADMGADVLEMDIHMTADGEIVVMHDETVDRTTDGSGAIPQMTLDEIKSLDAGYDWSPDEGETFPYRGQGITVPTMQEVFEAFPDMPMNIEIKQSEPSIAAPFCAMIRQYGREDSVLVASLDAGALAEFRAECPEVATSASQNEVIVFFVMETLLLGQGYSPTATAVQSRNTGAACTWSRSALSMRRTGAGCRFTCGRSTRSPTCRG